jgi:para-nitrobenzyl esterase
MSVTQHRLRRGLTAALATASITALLLTGGTASAAPSDRGPAAAPKSVVRIADGAVRGTQIGKAEAFLGVPYAAPPVMNLRFAPPAPPTPWRGVRDASRQAPACLQFQPGGIREIQATREDCLYLDLYRPQGVTRSAKLPVILWVHGGGYSQGTGVIYGGQTLAERTGSVVISINYRVGALG